MDSLVATNYTGDIDNLDDLFSNPFSNIFDFSTLSETGANDFILNDINNNNNVVVFETNIQNDHNEATIETSNNSLCFDNYLYVNLNQNDAFEDASSPEIETINTSKCKIIENTNVPVQSPAESISTSQYSTDSPASTSSSSFTNQINLLDLSVIKNIETIGKTTNDISFFLPETEKDGMKISNEIILNFEPVEAENVLDQYEMLDLDEKYTNPQTVSSNSNDTCLELEESMDLKDDSEDCESSGDLRLTEEEKMVFEKEGYKVPTHLPLTKSEEKILKLVRRKIRNKKSAHISRERKKKYVDGLEKRVDKCTKENQMLNEQIKLLKNQNSELINKLKSMQNCLSTILNKHKKSSTAVLFVSFFITFCVYPFIELSGEYDTGDQVYSASFRGISRTLLSTDEISTTTNIGSQPTFWDYFFKY